MAFVAALVLAISASMRAIYVLPMIPPLALASVAALRRPDGVLEKTLAVASTAFAVAGAVLVWSAWAMLAIEGRIPKWLPFSGYLTAEFAMPISIVPVAAALALSAGFAALVVLRRRLAASGLAIWVGSIACVWGLAHTLWLPWLDDAKSYRTLFAEVAQHLPSDRVLRRRHATAACVESAGRLPCSAAASAQVSGSGAAQSRCLAARVARGAAGRRGRGLRPLRAPVIAAAGG